MRACHFNPAKRTRCSNRFVQGFTLIELVIVIAIVAVLLGIAYPAYDQWVIKSRRADGKALLLLAAQRQQQFFTSNNSYTAKIGDGGLQVGTTSAEGYYTLSVSADATTYLLTATRVSPQTADTKCGDLTINHLGVKGNLNASEAAEKCW